MRIKITLLANKPGVIDFNYQHQIQAIIYRFLTLSDPDYGSWLHHQGFVYKNDKCFKMFVFSGITFCSPVQINKNARKGFTFNASVHSPFTFSFQIASPVEKFLQHLIDGIFQEGNEIILGRQGVSIYRVETLPGYLNNRNGFESIKLMPMESPLFVKKPMSQGIQDVYLYPEDEDYEDILNQNLVNKYETIYGKLYKGEPLRFQFHSLKGKSEKSFSVFNRKPDGRRYEIHIKGTLRPFTVTGPAELIKIGLECGFGQNNSMGCGYVDMVKDG